MLKSMDYFPTWRARFCAKQLRSTFAGATNHLSRTYIASELRENNKCTIVSMYVYCNMIIHNYLNVGVYGIKQFWGTKTLKP